MEGRVGRYITMHSGKMFYPFDYRKEDIDENDILLGISRELRYGGQTKEPYTVGRHLLSCARRAQDLGYTPYVQFLLLTHDFEEAYLRDIPKPLKMMFPEYERLSRELMFFIWERYYGLRKPTDEEMKLVDAVDRWMFEVEYKHLMPSDVAPLPGIEEVKMKDILKYVVRGTRPGSVVGEFKVRLSRLYDRLDAADKAAPVSCDSVVVRAV